MDRIVLMLAVFAVQSLSSFAQADPQVEKTRTLKAVKVQFTLPGPEWTWVETECTDVQLAAKSPVGFSIIIKLLDVVGDIGAEAPVIVDGLKSKGNKVLSHRIERFHSLESLVIVGVEPKFGFANVLRMFVANGKSIQLITTSQNPDIESTPEYKAAVNGFKFIVLPQLYVSPESRETTREAMRNLRNKGVDTKGLIMMAIAIVLVLLAGGGFLIWLLLRRSKVKKSKDAKSKASAKPKATITNEDTD